MFQASPPPRNPSGHDDAAVDLQPSPDVSPSPGRHRSEVPVKNRPSQPNGGTERYQDQQLVDGRLKICGNDNPDLDYDTEYYSQFSPSRQAEPVDESRFVHKSMLPSCAEHGNPYDTQNRSAFNGSGAVDRPPADRYKRTDVDKLRASKRDTPYDTTTRLEYTNPASKTGSNVIPKKA